MKNKFTLLFMAQTFCFSGMVIAQRNVAQFKDYTIREGEYSIIGGQKRYEPDVYYTQNPDGTYKAHRLTVQPDGALEDVSAPYLCGMRPDGVTIGWKTVAPPQNVEVIWGESADVLEYRAEFSSTTLSDNYFWNTAPITGLEPDHVYYYKVKSNGKESKVHRFHTMPQDGSQQVFRMLILGDHQRNVYSDYEWMLRMAERKLNEKFGEKPIEDHVSFIMNTGDQVDRGDLNQYENTHRFKSRYVMSHLPIQTVVGNHETYGDSELQLYNGHYKAAYQRAAYRGLDSGSASYYAYQTGRVLWIAINSDGISPQQLMWIRKVVAMADSDPTVDFILSVQHRPLYAEMYSKDYSAWMLDDVMPVLDSSPKHVMNCAGHHHLYARGQMPDEPVYHIISGGGVGVATEGYQQVWGETNVDLMDHDHVQATIDHWTYQILEFTPATRTMKVECYSVGNKRLALDNVLVDSFSRTLGTTDSPDTPQLVAPEGPLALPARLEQAIAVEGLHSAQYQVSRSEDFENPVMERIFTFENFYDVDDKFLPLDRYALRPVTRMDLDEGSLRNGTYYVRVRNRNMNLDYSQWSRPISITVNTPGVQEAGIELDKEVYPLPAQVKVTYANAPVGQNAWVGIYRVGHRPGTSDLSYTYDYTTAAQGSLTLQVKDAGRYFAVLFRDSGYEECTERIYFRVGPETEDFSVNKNAYSFGESVRVQLHNAPCGKNDWVGIYPSGIIPANAISPTWAYVGTNPNALITLNVQGTQNFKQPLPDGVYFVNYFLDNGYKELYERKYFVIGTGCLLESVREEYTQENPVILMWEGVPQGLTCTLARSENGGWVDVQEITQSGGTTKVENLPVGEHTFCIRMDGVSVSKPCKVLVSDGSSIQNVITQTDGPKGIYSLSGQRLSLRNLPRGVYVMDGRKVKQ